MTDHCSEETHSLSMIRGDMEVREEEGSSAWVLQNIQKFSRSMGVNFEGIEDHVYSFFYEINRRRFEKNGGEGSMGTKGKKKQCEGTLTELKLLESSINFDGRKEGIKRLGEVNLMSQ